MTTTAPNGTTDPTTAAQLLQQRSDDINRASEVIDRDPEEAKAKLEPVLQAPPNVGEITPGDMFRLMSQMQQQMASMQTQIVDLMIGRANNGNGQRQNGPDLQKELHNDQIQREATLEAWRTEPREPVFINPDQDEQMIFKVTNDFPPRVFRVNGLEFPIKVGEITNVPNSIAALVRHTQRIRPMSGAPQGLAGIADPQKGKFLVGAASIESGRPGATGEGQLIPDQLPPPMPLGLKYDHNGL